MLSGLVSLNKTLQIFGLPKAWDIEIAKRMKSADYLLLHNLLQDLKARDDYYPPFSALFRAFQFLEPLAVKVLILGQDPYHGEGQADGLAFSVPPSFAPLPPSLRNIRKEIQEDIGRTELQSGDLTSWARQGVFLLNTVLSVEKKLPGSHQNIGWEPFSDAVLRVLDEVEGSRVFLLWGNWAKGKQCMINSGQHLVLIGPHPSPLSAYRGFFGSKHFSQVNDWLINKGLGKIDW